MEEENTSIDNELNDTAINNGISNEFLHSRINSTERLFTEGNEDNSFDVSEREDEFIIKDRSRLCYVCDTGNIEIFFICGNGLCSECTLEHIKSQISKYKIKVLSEKINFVCAGSCKCEVDKEIIEKFMDHDTKKIYDEVLLKMYLSKASDVVSCPLSNCQGFGFIKPKPYFGIFTLSNFSNNNCYECPLCNHKWTDKEGGLTDYIDPRILIKQFSISNLKSILIKFITTKYCNKCSAPIEKAEGCKHIECNRCEYSFCWKCTDDWKTHIETSCMGLLTNEYEESFRPDFLGGLLFFLFIFINLKVLFSFLIIFKILWWIVKIICFFGLLAMDAVLLHGALLSIIKHNSKNKFIFILGLIVLIEGLLYYYSLHPYSEKLYFYAQITILPFNVSVMAYKRRYSS